MIHEASNEEHQRQLEDTDHEKFAIFQTKLGNLQRYFSPWKFLWWFFLFGKNVRQFKLRFFISSNYEFHALGICEHRHVDFIIPRENGYARPIMWYIRTTENKSESQAIIKNHENRRGSEHDFTRVSNLHVRLRRTLSMSSSAMTAIILHIKDYL